MDIDIGRQGNIEDVFTLLSSGPVALKACNGGHGKGFYKIQKDGNEFAINNKPAKGNDVKRLIESLDDYILTEYGIPHKVFREACGEQAFAVLRTVSVFDKDDGPQITAILIRLGTSTSGLVTDYDGCINAGVDLKTGRIFNPLQRGGDAEGIITRRSSPKHPDTDVDLESLVVPHFEELIKMTKAVSAHLSMTPYLVMDIIPTDDGFEILEINSHGQVRNLEPFFPFRKNKYNLRAFETRDW